MHAFIVDKVAGVVLNISCDHVYSGRFQILLDHADGSISTYDTATFRLAGTSY